MQVSSVIRDSDSESGGTESPPASQTANFQSSVILRSAHNRKAKKNLHKTMPVLKLHWVIFRLCISPNL